jgi:hypothetical protein
LQATFVLPDESLLTAFSVHFPAPFHPTQMRVAAYQHLASLLAALPDDHHAFAAGDFNTTSKEDADVGMLDKYARPHWTLAHDVGCSECKGSYFYGGDSTWSFLEQRQLLLRRRLDLVISGYDFLRTGAWRKNNSANSRGFRVDRERLCAASRRNGYAGTLCECKRDRCFRPLANDRNDRIRGKTIACKHFVT